MTKTPPGVEKFWIVTFLSLAGPLIWAIHFGFVYGVQHLLCSSIAPGANETPLTIFVMAATIGALIPLAFLGLWPSRAYEIAGIRLQAEAASAFLIGAMRAATLLSVTGVLWVGAAALFVGGCTSLR